MGNTKKHIMNARRNILGKLIKKHILRYTLHVTRFTSNVTRYTLHVTRLKAFTLIELMVSVSVIALLVGFSSMAYLNVQKNSDLSNQTAQLVSSIRQAQALALSGQTLDGENQLDIGIHLETAKYVLFYGHIYSPTDPRNIETNLPSGISITNNLPTTELMFEQKIGEVKSYDDSQNTITINQSGASNILTINKLGVVDVN